MSMPVVKLHKPTQKACKKPFLSLFAAYFGAYFAPLDAKPKDCYARMQTQLQEARLRTERCQNLKKF